MVVKLVEMKTIEEASALSTILYAEINIVGAILLLLLLNNIYRSGMRDIPADQWIFNGIMFLNLLIFIFDTGMWLMDGRPHAALRFGNYVMTTLYYLLNPIISFLWLMYTDIKIYESRLDLLKRTRFYVIPAAVTSIMSLASPFTGWFFVIDEENRYMRGSLFLIMALTAISYLIISCGISLYDFYKNGWEKNKSINLYLAAFSVWVMAAAVIQIMFFGVSIIWVCSMLGCVSIYINLQNREVSTDYLTGLFNRRRLDQHLLRRIKTKRNGRLLFAILLDVDEFKNINDNYGHSAGDSVLVETAKLLRKTCRNSDDFIARLGGDEFIIVGERTEYREIEQLMNEVHSSVNDYNQSCRLNYNLQISMGYSVFDRDDTADTFLAAADREMYRSKKDRKQRECKTR